LKSKITVRLKAWETVGNFLIDIGGHLLKPLTISYKDFKLNKEAGLLKLLVSFIRNRIYNSTEN